MNDELMASIGIEHILDMIKSILYIIASSHLMIFNTIKVGNCIMTTVTGL